MAVPERKGEESPLSRPRDTARASVSGGQPSEMRPVRPSPADQDRADPNPFQINRMLWILLGLATVFLVAVQIYVRTSGNSLPLSTESVAEVPILDAMSPVLPIRAVDLSLRWDTVQGAVQYHLRIHTVQGTPVVDPMLVWGEQWRPSSELLPGLMPGSYRWSVEAVDGVGRILGRSLPMEFEIESK